MPDFHLSSLFFLFWFVVVSNVLLYVLLEAIMEEWCWMECKNPATNCFILQYPRFPQSSGSLEPFGIVFCLPIQMVQRLILLLWGRGVSHVVLGADSCFCLCLCWKLCTVTTLNGKCPCQLKDRRQLLWNMVDSSLPWKSWILKAFSVYLTWLQHISAMLIAMVCDSHSPDRTGPSTQSFAGCCEDAPSDVFASLSPKAWLQRWTHCSTRWLELEKMSTL